MKNLILTTALAGVAAAQSGLLTSEISSLPSCASSAFASALEKAGCTSGGTVTPSTFYCMCDTQLDSVSDEVATSIAGSSCVQTWATVFGTACGYYIYDTTTASSDLQQAVQELASYLGDSSSSSGSDSSAVAATSTSDADPFAATQGPADTTTALFSNSTMRTTSSAQVTVGGGGNGGNGGSGASGSGVTVGGSPTTTATGANPFGGSGSSSTASAAASSSTSSAAVPQSARNGAGAAVFVAVFAALASVAALGVFVL